MKTKLLIALFFGAVMQSLGQTTELSFVQSNLTFQKNNSESTHKLSIKVGDISDIGANLLEVYTVHIRANETLSTLPPTDYTIGFRPIRLKELKADSQFDMYLTLHKDSIPDRDRKLVLEIFVSKAGEDSNINAAGIKGTLDITVKPLHVVNQYNYLAYVGTNFDLIDGAKPKNLFFSVNVFSPPSKDELTGFYLNLYGNRTMSEVDTVGRKTYLSRIEGLGDGTSEFFYNEGLMQVSKVSDNLGATFSFLFNLAPKTKKSTFDWYYAPHSEFIWRRIKTITEYTEIDEHRSEIRDNRPITNTLIITPEKSQVAYQVYDVYLSPIGLLLKKEDENISIRVQTAIGRNYSYSNENISNPNNTIATYERTKNWYFLARTWITEPHSGVTIGAEVFNILVKNHRPYYNVTLSKAISLRNLGSIFAPITDR